MSKNDKSRSTPGIRVLLPFVWPFRGRLLLALGAMVVDAFLTALRPWPIKIVIDRVISDDATRVPLISEWVNDPTRDPLVILHFACVSTILIAIGTGVFTYLFMRTMGDVSQRLVYNLRTHLFSRLQRLSLQFHKTSQLGDTMTRLTTDISAIQMLLASGSLMFLSNAMLLMTMVAMMLWLNWQFTLIACSVSPLLFCAVWWHTSKIKAASKQARDLDGQLASLAQETLSSIHVVKGFGQEDRQSERFRQQGRRSLVEYLARVRLQARMAPMVDICAAVGLCLVMWFGAKSVRDGSLTTGDIVVFFAYVTNFFSPMRAMSRQAAAFAKAAAGADRVAEILVSNDEVREAPDAIDMPRSRGQIEFRNVSFAYERGPSVLHGLSLHIEAGETIAILGTTGAGKSTLASLLLRLYDPGEGSIFVDGYDIRTLKLASLRQQIGLVLQESLLFRGTLKENIAFGCPDADDRQIAQAAQVAHVDEFASRLELGLDSTVDERGTSLSGGQRQRVAIARAILRDAPILVLDEPTCSLDNVSESIVLEALKSAAEGRTTILITHRLTTARLADRIVVLEGGRIVEQGTFAELLDLGGRFALLASKETALATAG